MLQRFGHGPGLALVCERWDEDGVYDFLLCFHLGYWDVSVMGQAGS